MLRSPALPSRQPVWMFGTSGADAARSCGHHAPFTRLSSSAQLPMQRPSLDQRPCRGGGGFGGGRAALLVPAAHSRSRALTASTDGRGKVLQVAASRGAAESSSDGMVEVDVGIVAAAGALGLTSTTEGGPVFNLALAVEMAAAAFEAYMQPVGAEGFYERSMSGAKTTYTNKEFLSEMYQGVLSVELKRGKDLRVADITGASDPYVVLSLGGSTAQSKTIRWTVNPVWNESFLLYVRDIEQDRLSLRAYDEDFFKSDDDLGTAMLQLGVCADGLPHSIDLPLLGPEAKGSIELQVTFLRFEPGAPAAGPLLDTLVAKSVIMPEKAPAPPDKAEQARRLEAAVVLYLEAASAAEREGKGSASATVGGLPFGLPNLDNIRDLVMRELGQRFAAQEDDKAAAATAADTASSSGRGAVAAAASQNGNSGGKSDRSAKRAAAAESAATAATARSEDFSAIVRDVLARAAAVVALGETRGGDALSLDSVSSSSDSSSSEEEEEGRGPGGLLPSSALVDQLKSQVLSALGLTSDVTAPAAMLEKGPKAALEDPLLQAEGDPAANPWRVLAAASGRQDRGDCVPVAFVEEDGTDSQVWLYRNVVKREVIIAFRGTEQVKWKDIVTDLNMGTARLDVERTDHNFGLPFTLRALKAFVPTDEILVHQGFLAGYDSVKREVVRLLDRITGTADDGPKWRVFVTGHSLGGALATLCAFELSTREHPARQRQGVSMYTFGAPRVGNKAFAALFNSAVRDSWRISNSKDIIPSVPRLMGYAHVRHSVQLTTEGTLLVQSDSKDIFGEGKSQVEVAQEFLAAVQEKTKKWEDLYDEIREHELQVLDTLVDGSAMEHHMESFYLQTLQMAAKRVAEHGEHWQRLGVAAPSILNKKEEATKK